MPSLPKAELSIASAKVAGYILDVAHPTGGAKARFFLSFGFSADRPEVFVEFLFRHVSDDHFIRSEPSVWGTKYIFEGPLSTPDRRNPTIRSIWQTKFSKEGVMEFVTAYPLS